MSENAPDTRRAKFRVTEGSLTLKVDGVERLVGKGEALEVLPGAKLQLVATEDTGCFLTCQEGEALMSCVEGMPENPSPSDALFQQKQDEGSIPTPLLAGYTYFLELPLEVATSVRQILDEDGLPDDGRDEFYFDVTGGNCGGGGAMD